jgi:hypothetical protein
LAPPASAGDEKLDPDPIEVNPRAVIADKLGFNYATPGFDMIVLVAKLATAILSLRGWRVVQL